MKHLLPILTILAAVSFNAWAQGNEPVMTFEFETYDFGNIQEGAEASVDFVFTNTGKSNLIITEVNPSCQCTEPVWSREPVAPGQKGVITVGYNTVDKSGSFNKSITISSNANEEIKRIFIKGNVIVSGTTN